MCIEGLAILGIIGVLAPCLANDNKALLFNPLTNCLHTISHKQSGIKAVLIKSLLYFSKPIDRVIQAIVAPIFVVITHISFARHSFSKANYGMLTLVIITTPIEILALPIFFLLNGALQVVIPYQTFYAMMKTKASDKYLTFRSELQKTFDTYQNILNKDYQLAPQIQNSQVDEDFFEDLLYLGITNRNVNLYF